MGDSVSLYDKMTSFIKLIITCDNRKMLQKVELAPHSPTRIDPSQPM